MIDRRRWLAAIAASIVLTTFLVIFARKLPMERLDVPYTFAATAGQMAQIHNVAETGWLFTTIASAIIRIRSLDFPRFDSLNYAIWGDCRVDWPDGLAFNPTSLPGLPDGLAALYSFRGLGLSAGTALLCSLLFAFLPYHVVRGVTHVTNGAYFLVPLGMLVLAWIARGDLEGSGVDTRRRWLLAIPVAVMLPLQTPYNGVFFAGLCLVAGAIAIAQRPRWRSVLPVLVLLASVLVPSCGTDTGHAAQARCGSVRDRRRGHTRQRCIPCTSTRCSCPPPSIASGKRLRPSAPSTTP